MLERAGVVRRAKVFELASELHVEAAREPDALAALRGHWGQMIASRAAATRPHEAFGYNLVAIGRDDLDEIRQILRRAYREMRARVATSEDPEVAAFVGLQLFVFDGPRGISHR